VRKLTAIGLPLVLATVLAGTAGAMKLPPPPNLPAGWSHAQINVVVRRVPHTLTYDHGRITAVSPTSLTLREPDGSVVTIALDSSTRVLIDGRTASIDQVRRLETATTVSVDGGPAALVKVRIPPRVAAMLRLGGGR
jgi:hypothetical protein